MAAQGNHTLVVKSLLKADADTNIARNDGNTPLLIASQEGYLKVVKRLLVSGTAVNHANNSGVTSLLFASQEGYREIVKELLECGADVRIKVVQGGKEYTALSLAKIFDDEETISLLKEYGAKE
jgi:serine/threonine-protein phosphatase 6 regulatory ankyrin repeat subunit B